ncbi:MAG: glycerol dehydrogenase [Coriobacteriales bacterium]
MLDRVFISPSRYVQGNGTLAHLADYTSFYGDTVLIVESAGGKKRMHDVIEASRAAAPDQTFVEEVSTECTMDEINRLAAIAKEIGADLIVGMGGGKVLDTAKGAAHVADLPVMCAPTNAASDAPCSALSVVYKPGGPLDQLLMLRRNPDVVLVDNEVIAAGPASLLAAGMGDALATYFEMKALYDADGPNFIGSRITLAAYAIAEQCYKTLVDSGYKAYLACGRHVVTRALEDVIEANILLSGVGFESGGTSGAHAINNGLSSNPRAAGHAHGEFVAFSTIAHLIIVDADEHLIWETIGFLDSIGLPVTLAQLGYEGGITDEELDFAAGIADSDGLIHQIVKTVELDTIKAAILAADAMGEEFKNQHVC